MRLNDRLALAVQDVTARAGGVSQSSGRAAEPRAVAPQVPEVENILDSEAEMELLRRRNEDDGKSTGRGRGKASGRGARSFSPKPGAPASSAKRPAEEAALSSTARWLELPAAQRARVKKEPMVRLVAKAELEQLPPWKMPAQSCGEENFWSDGKRIVPRWEVEATLRRQFEQSKEEPELDQQLLSKAGTQLLRWGRTDLRAKNGSVTTLVLPTWEPEAWVPLSELAEVLGVGTEVLRAALPSIGRHGDRVEIMDNAARALWHE